MGVALRRMVGGGWIADDVEIPKGSTAEISDDVLILGGTIRGGMILGGTIWGGTIEGGTIRGGTIWGGTIEGGTIRGGTIRGGMILGGTIRGGTIEGGTIEGGTIEGGTIRGGAIRGGAIRGGTIEGGTIRGGVFTKSPSCAQRSDGYMFVAKIIESGELRIWAGCRNFSWDEAVAHWSTPGHPHSAESLRIINFLKEQENATHHV
jgi:hypothetical protein